MKSVFISFAVLFAFIANVSSADLDFSDSKAWKISANSSSALRFSSLVAKYKNNVYINSFIYDAISMNAFAGICPGRGVEALTFDKFGNTWVATDSGVVRQSATDTVVYYKKDGLPSNDIRAIYYDADSNRIVVGCFNAGVSATKLDGNGKATAWVNALSVSIHQIVVVRGEVWAINNKIVYRLVSGSWVEYPQFGSPCAGDVDANGNFWLSFGRVIPGTVTVETGLAKFDGQKWTEYFVSTALTSYFGKIIIDCHNVLWFTGGNKPGNMDIATMTIDRSAGSLPWAPEGQDLAISKKDDGEVIFAGAYAWIEKISTSAVINPRFVRNPTIGYSKVVGVFLPNGRKISAANSFSRSSSGLRLVVVQTPHGFVTQRVLISK